MIVTPAPEEPKAIAAPAAEAPAEPEEEPAPEEEPEETAAGESAEAEPEDDEDYIKAFERAVFSGADIPADPAADDTIPTAEDADEEPGFRF